MKQKPAGEMTAEERIADIFRDPTYERRIVVFFDALGWRSQITQAGNDPSQLGKLRRFIIGARRILVGTADSEIKKKQKTRITTFSDNVVISQTMHRLSPILLIELGVIQIAALLDGILLRGGVTIGDIIHEEEVVFGPGLNRAYELESKVADKPRIVLDESFLRELRITPNIIAEEDGLKFIDPFSVDFIGHLRKIETSLGTKDLTPLGLPTVDSFRFVEPIGQLKLLLERLKAQLRLPLNDRDWAKVAWLYDRIATRLGVPPASSYPRIPTGTG